MKQLSLMSVLRLSTLVCGFLFGFFQPLSALRAPTQKSTLYGALSSRSAEEPILNLKSVHTLIDTPSSIETFDANKISEPVDTKTNNEILAALNKDVQKDSEKTPPSLITKDEPVQTLDLTSESLDTSAEKSPTSEIPTVVPYKESQENSWCRFYSCGPSSIRRGCYF